ncbi:sulfotransferase [Roseomonas terrae]|uniref:Sulfotransferase n=1 Tax=Neoroseomonas terrae TaxID=424799 RepID=A0ABS5EGZ5_9PROT|nr:sulfotransferase [Neoroseomonas terrae]MBR0649932.1 sulfotransferase [Neoroseomonas terrae]
MTAAAQQEMRYPDFLCIGAQKAGTTWLDANLRRHPQIWMPWIKELQFFNDVHIPAHRAWTGRHRWQHAEKAARRLVRRAEDKPLDMTILHRITSIGTSSVSDDWYGRIFAHARADQVCGEVTPEYSLLPVQGIEHVKRLNPELKIIFLLRDPVDRCWSHLRMLAKNHTKLDLLQAAQSSDVLDRSNFVSIYQKWVSIFGFDKIYLSCLKNIAETPCEFLGDICRFLGISVHSKINLSAYEPVFVGERLEMPEAIRAVLERRLERVRDEMRALPIRRVPMVAAGVGS